jgi:hypothetical protein
MRESLSQHKLRYGGCAATRPLTERQRAEELIIMEGNPIQKIFILMHTSRERDIIPTSVLEGI